MSNLSRCRSEGRRAAKSIRYSSNFGNQRIGYIKKPKKKPTFLEYCLIDKDMVVLMDPEDIIPQYMHKDPSRTVYNHIFPNQKIQCDKVGLIYSQKKKIYYYLAMNDNYTCYILFKGKELRELPEALSTKIDLEHINPNFVVSENANRLMCCVYDEVVDCTANPLMIYKTSELFRK